MSENGSTSKVVVKQDSEYPAGMPESFTHLTKNMENELEKRKQNWEDEVSLMQKDFFQMKTTNGQKQIGGKTKVVEMRADSNAPRRRKGAGAAIFDISHAKTLYSDNADGTKTFKLRFDVKGYEPHEIGIKAEGQKLIVTAKTEEEAGNDKATKQFNRQVDIPKSVDPDKLVSFLSADGILSVEAPVEYDEDDEEGEEVEVIYPDAMMGRALPAGVEPPLYEHVVDGGPMGGVHSYSSRQNTLGVPGAGYSFSSHHGAPGGGGGGGYSYHSSSSTSGQPYVMAPSVSYEYHSCHHGAGHHDCHHKEGPRRPLETHVKRTKNPPSKVDYFKAVSPQRSHTHYSHHSTPGLTGSVLASSLIGPSSGGSSYTSSSSSSSRRSPATMGSMLGPSSGGSSYTSSISSSSKRGPTTIINESYRYNEPSIVGGEDDGGKRLKLMVDVGRDYTPEDVHVTLYAPRTLAVKANSEQTVDGRTSKKKFSRDFNSPEDLESHTARASLSTDGKLYIGACVKGNKNQDKVMQNVLNDLPDDATACKLSLE